MDVAELVEMARMRRGECGSCGAPLSPGDLDTGPNLMCRECGMRHCPFCGAEVESCDHFIVTTGEIDADGQDAELALPSIDVSAPAREMLQRDLDARLGTLAPIAVFFEDYLGGEEWARWDETMLIAELLGRLDEPVASLPWGGWWMAASSGTDHFAERGAAARNDLKEIWEELEHRLAGFPRLADGEIQS